MSEGHHPTTAALRALRSIQPEWNAILSQNLSYYYVYLLDVCPSDCYLWRSFESPPLGLFVGTLSKLPGLGSHDMKLQVPRRWDWRGISNVVSSLPR